MGLITGACSGWARGSFRGGVVLFVVLFLSMELSKFFFRFEDPGVSPTQPRKRLFSGKSAGKECAEAPHIPHHDDAFR